MGQTTFKPASCWALTNHHNLMSDLSSAQLIDSIGKDIKTFFHHQSSKKAYYWDVICKSL